LIGGLKIIFIGLYNWGKLFFDERYYNALKNTLLIVGIGVSVQYLLGLVLAILLNKKTIIKGRAFFRVLFILPMTFSPVAVGYIWRMLFHVTRGPVNDILVKFGLAPVNWTGNSLTAIYSIILIDIWHWTPLIFLVLLAALQAIPLEIFEAAEIDGASEWGKFRFIIFPMLIPFSVALILLRVIEGLKIIDKIYVLTAGGPGISTESITLYAYNKGLVSFDLAYGATISISLLVMLIVICVLFLFILSKFRIS